MSEPGEDGFYPLRFLTFGIAVVLTTIVIIGLGHHLINHAQLNWDRFGWVIFWAVAAWVLYAIGWRKKRG